MTNACVMARQTMGQTQIASSPPRFAEVDPGVVYRLDVGDRVTVTRRRPY